MIKSGAKLLQKLHICKSFGKKKEVERIFICIYEKKVVPLRQICIYNNEKDSLSFGFLPVAVAGESGQ